MDDEKKSLTSKFNLKSFAWHALKYTVMGIGVSFLAFGIADFVLFHDHPLGQWMMSPFKEPLMGVFDSIASFIGKPELMRSAEFIGGGANLAGGTLGAGATDVASSVAGAVNGACTMFDATTMDLVPC